jgi:chromosome partitioning protein
MRIIAVINQKGGVGKTTTVACIAAGLAKQGKQVLAIDLDPQSHLTFSLGVSADKGTLYDIFRRGATLNEAIVQRGTFDVLPSSIDLAGAELEYITKPNWQFMLKKEIRGLEQYDYILIDCPPSLGLLTVNALTSADEIYIPLQPETLALQGLGKLMEIVETVKADLNSKLEITGVVATRYDNRKSLNREVLDQVKQHFGDRVFSTVIRENVALAEAPGHAQTIFEYKPKSTGAEDYESLTREILEREVEHEQA